MCPFNAIKIIKLSEQNPEELVYRYTPNSFMLYKLPTMKKNCVISKKIFFRNIFINNFVIYKNNVNYRSKWNRKKHNS